MKNYKGLDEAIIVWNEYECAVRMMLDLETNEIWVDLFASLNSWTVYDDNVMCISSSEGGVFFPRREKASKKRIIKWIEFALSQREEYKAFQEYVDKLY